MSPDGIGVPDLGAYEVLSDTRHKEAGLRVLLVKKGIRIKPHYHERCTQVYFIIDGRAEIVVGGQPIQARQMDVVRIPPCTVHGLRALVRTVALSISVPPLDPEDQVVVDEPTPAGPFYAK